VLVYRQVQSAGAPAAATSAGTGQRPGQGGGQAGPGSVTEMQLVARVTAVGSRTVTLGGGPVQSVTATVTSGTKFTGSVHTLAGVRVGDIVAAQITIADGTARVVSLQDPASES